VIEAGSSIRNCIVMGADFYAGAENAPSDAPPPGIGKGCKIEQAIIDKNVHIGDNVVITPKGKPDNFDSPDGMFYIRDGIIVLPKGAYLPSGTWI